MWEKLEKVFKAIGLDYSRQGSYAADAEFPTSFFTFWNYDIPEDGFFDNKSNRAIWIWQVYFYTSDPNIIYSKMQEFIDLAKKEGFIPDSRGMDIPAGIPNYMGRMVQIKFIENY